MKKYFKRGNILLVRYKVDILGFLIRAYTKSYWNHVVWIYDENNVIDVRGHFIKIRPISEYLNNKKYAFKILELKNINKQQKEKVLSNCLFYLGNMSYFMWIVSLLGIFFNVKKELPQVTCSGLVAKSLSTQNWFFFAKKPIHLITPEDINRSKNVKGLYVQK